MRHARADYNRFQDPDERIPTDEPVFLLRGQDVIANIVVDFYADQAEHIGADPKLVQRCREWAAEMRAWTKKKIPDMPDYA